LLPESDQPVKSEKKVAADSIAGSFISYYCSCHPGIRMVNRHSPLPS